MVHEIIEQHLLHHPPLFPIQIGTGGRPMPWRNWPLFIGSAHPPERLDCGLGQ
jgi:hypothetical protein